MIEIDMKLPSCCDECFAFNDYGCMISGESCGHSFKSFESRMPSCPMKDAEPRVLTLEEVTTGDECWFEHKSGVCGYVDCYICTGNQSVEVWRTSKRGPDYLSWERYLKSWRCWSAKPTDEQRESVKWDE